MGMGINISYQQKHQRLDGAASKARSKAHRAWQWCWRNISVTGMAVFSRSAALLRYCAFCILHAGV